MPKNLDEAGRNNFGSITPANATAKEPFFSPIGSQHASRNAVRQFNKTMNFATDAGSG